VNPLFAKKKVVRLADREHPGVLLGRGSYIADAQHEASSAAARRSFQVMSLPDESGAPSVNFTLDVTKATKEQMREASDYAAQAVPDTSTLEGQQGRTEVRLSRLRELMSMQDNKAWNIAPQGASPWQQAATIPAGIQSPGSQPWAQPYQVPQAAPPMPGEPMPWLQKQAASGQPSQQPAPPYQPPAQGPQFAAPPPTVQVQFWLPQVKFPAMYHDVNVQYTKDGQHPVAIYLVCDNRFAGAAPYLADTIEGEFGVQISNEPRVYVCEATGLIHTFRDWTIAILMVDRAEELG
jgi:single-stranded DNA-binding protein